MKEQLFKTTGELEIVPAADSSHTDFDFWMGKWKIENRKLKTRLKDCNEWLEFEATGETISILNGFGNFDQYHATFDGVPFAGMTLRLFNPQTRLWSIYWAASSTMVLEIPVTGSFDGPIGRFYSRETWEGTPIICQFKWDKTNPDAPSWSQAFSTDYGSTWEWNWYMNFSRA